MTNEIATVTVARFPDPSGIWFFACSTGDHISFGPLTTAWDGGSQLRDLEIHGRVADLVVAVPPTLDHDDVRSELRRVPALVGARIRIYTVTPADITVAIGLPAPSDGSMPSLDDLRRALGERLPGVELAGMEDGAMMALATLLAGVEAHRRWFSRFGEVGVDIVTHPLNARRLRVDRTDRQRATAARQASAARDGAAPPKPQRATPADRFALATAPGDTLLTVSDIVAMFQVSRSFAYSLKAMIPFSKFGGLRFRKADVERHLADIQQRPVLESIRQRRRAGTPVARPRPDHEVAPGLTAAELKKRVGF